MTPVMIARKIVWFVRLFSIPRPGNAPSQKVQVPALMAPRTVTRPSRLNQAVSQPVKRFPRIEPQ
jgi:hypothetical protein